MARRVIRADFHLHSLEPVELPQRPFDTQTPEVLGLTAYCHSIDETRLKQLSGSCLTYDKSICLPVLELACADGHMSLIDYDSPNALSPFGSYMSTLDSQLLRVINHPDGLSNSWNMNLLPDINGIEVLNARMDTRLRNYENMSKSMRTWLEHMLLRTRVAAIGQSDGRSAGEAGSFGTLLYIPEDEQVSRLNILNSLRRGNTIAYSGDARINFFGRGAMPGDSLPGGSDIRWDAPEGSRVSLYVGDELYWDDLPLRAKLTPKRNGPHWLFVRKGAYRAVTSPIWVSGVRLTGDVLEDKRAILIKHIDESELTGLFEHARDMAKEYPRLEPWISGYLNWLTPFQARRLSNDELSAVSIDALKNLHCRRIGLMARIMERLIADATHYIDTVPDGHILLHKQAGDWNRLLKIKIELPPDVKSVCMVSSKGDSIPCDVKITERTPVADEWRLPDQMEDILLWLTQGYSHGMCMEQPQMMEGGGVLQLEYVLSPLYIQRTPMSYATLAQQLKKKLETGDYHSCHLIVYRYNEALLTIDTLLMSGRWPTARLFFESGKDWSAQLADIPFHRHNGEPVWATWRPAASIYHPGT